MRRVISVWLPRFATDRWSVSRRRRTARPGRSAAWRADRNLDKRPTARAEPPFALIAEARGRLILAAVNPAAADAGLGPGLPLADARAILPSLATDEAAPEADAEALARLAAWCGRYTPWSAVDPAGAIGAGCDAGGGAGLLLDVTGCAQLFGGEAALAADLVARLGRLGYAATAALADTPGAAWALARFACGPGRTSLVVPPGAQAAALAPLPPAALRLSAERLELLERFGLTRIEAIMAIPPAALAPRFGDQVARRLNQALGREREPISPALAEPPPLARQIFAEPILTAEAIAGGIERLAVDLCAQLEKTQRGARRLTLTLYRVDGTLARGTLGTNRPSRDPAHLGRLFAGKLERFDPGFGIEVMTLEAARSEPLSALQLSLAAAGLEAAAASAPGAERSATPADKALADCLDRLSARLGADNVIAPAPYESHLPERAVRPRPPLAADAPAWSSTAEAPPRPLRLFDPPQPVEALALLPDHPPAQFRWRRLNHRIARAEGPERIAPEWWREPEVIESDSDDMPFPDPVIARDYFRVEDGDGRRYWLYRSAGPVVPAGLVWVKFFDTDEHGCTRTTVNNKSLLFSLFGYPCPSVFIRVEKRLEVTIPYRSGSVIELVV